MRFSNKESLTKLKQQWRNSRDSRKYSRVSRSKRTHGRLLLKSSEMPELLLIQTRTLLMMIETPQTKLSIVTRNSSKTSSTNTVKQCKPEMIKRISSTKLPE
jgi:hypothetical protein